MVDAGFIRESFIKYWQKNNFERLNPISVVPSQDWFNTLFVNAGLVRYLQIIKQERKLPYSLVSCQPCIKLGFGTLSLEQMVMKDGYFTFFEQLTCGGDESISESWFIGKVWEYLTVVAGLVPERIFIGVSSLQPEYRDYWVGAGAGVENILFPDPEAFVLHLEREDVRGVYSPFYYDRGKNHPLACQKPSCGTNCSCGRFLEIGDIGIVYAGKARIIDHGIGLERIVAVQNALTRVTDIEEFTMVIDVFKEKLEVDDLISLVIADHLRSTIILLAYGVRPGNKGREYALRRLLRRLFRLLPQVNKSQDFEKLYCQVFARMSNYLPYLKVQKDIVITPALKEFEKYQNLFAQGGDILRRFLRQRKNIGDLTEEEKGFLYETYGLSSEIIDAILADLRD